MEHGHTQTCALHPTLLHPKPYSLNCEKEKILNTKKKAEGAPEQRRLDRNSGSRISCLGFGGLGFSLGLSFRVQGVFFAAPRFQLHEFEKALSAGAKGDSLQEQTGDSPEATPQKEAEAEVQPQILR